MNGDAQGYHCNNKSNERPKPSPFCARKVTFHRAIWIRKYDEAGLAARQASMCAKGCISSAMLQQQFGRPARRGRASMLAQECRSQLQGGQGADILFCRTFRHT